MREHPQGFTLFVRCDDTIDVAGLRGDLQHRVAREARKDVWPVQVISVELSGLGAA